MNKTYCESLTSYERFKTPEVFIGNVAMGGDNPIRVQTMTNTDTGDTEESVAQIIRIIEAGADYVRLTTRSVKEAENLQNIKSRLRQEGYSIPLIADVHFNPEIAETAARIVEKVRINPGNYSIKKSSLITFQDTKKTFLRLIEICKAHSTAIRIGVNHGSLAQRIIDEYGDTPEGMVHSAMEFLEICREADFHQVVVSMKSSNTRVMVQANRLLVNQMLQNNLVCPIHLGVTEAGEGEDGRIKSAVGIGTLLADGVGDTIRISLTEKPEKEIPVAQKLLEHIDDITEHEIIPVLEENPIDPFQYQKRRVQKTPGFDKNNIPVFTISRNKSDNQEITKLKSLQPDFIIQSHGSSYSIFGGGADILPFKLWDSRKEDVFPYFTSIHHYISSWGRSKQLNFIFSSIDELESIASLKSKRNIVIVLQTLSSHPVIEYRRFIFELLRQDIHLPVILHANYNTKDLEEFQVKAATDLGPLFIDGLADGICIENRALLLKKNLKVAFGILQASRIRIFKTEFISCPGCGRTQFDLERTTHEIRKELGHLKGLKIAVMGCIVNGPGEMADADYGYVGAGNGKVTLYKNKTPVKKNIPAENALNELKQLIKQSGDWKKKK